MNKHELFMQRAIDLANLGSSLVQTNPNVGAVIVHEDRIIGEGFHKCFGEAHAEVNAINSIPKNKLHLLPKSNIYISLEPCNHFGKTPPCTNLIIEKGIRNVFISCLDPNPKMKGRSVQLLKEKGIQLTTGILEEKGKHLLRAFSTNVRVERPHVILKFAQSSDFFLGKPNEQIWLSNSYSKTFSHRLRSEVNAILVGRKTAETDDPELNNRLYKGSSPLRIIIDPENRLSAHLNVLKGDFETLIISNSKRKMLHKNTDQWIANFDDSFLGVLLKRLYKEKGISKILIEGGAFTLNEFIKQKLWDEAYIITAPIHLNNGIPSPHINGKLIEKWKLDQDEIIWMRNS